MHPPVLLDFTNVVDESEELPLHIDFGFRADREMIQPFLDAEVSKDRLHDRQPPGIDLPAFRCIDPGFHMFDQIGMQTAHLNG